MTMQSAQNREISKPIPFLNVESSRVFRCCFCHQVRKRGQVGQVHITLRSDTPMRFRYETFIRQLNKPRSSGRLIDTHSINGWLSYAAFLVLLAATTWALGVARSLVGSDGSVN